MAFMQPTAAYFTADEAREYTQHDGMMESEIEDHDPGAGWYGYLSAAGYMDRTDYMGPFDTADEAIKAVMELYEVDENGDELTEETQHCGECGEEWPCSIERNRKSYRPDVVVMHTIER